MSSTPHQRSSLSLEKITRGAGQASWKVFWNTSAQVIGRLVGAGTTFFISILIARAFGAEGYGDFAKVTTYVALFYLLADFGMNAVFLQKTNESIANPPGGGSRIDANNKSWGELLGVRVVGSVVFMFLALAILVFLPQGVGQGYTAAVRLGIILLLPSILFQAIITTTNAEFQRRLRYDLATIAIVAGALVTIATVVGIVGGIKGIGVIGVIGGIGVGMLISALVALGLIKKFETPLGFTITRFSLLSYFTRSLPLGMTLVFNLIYFRADHFILALSRTTSEVGIYGLAYKVFEFPISIPTFFMNSVYPLLLAQLTQTSNLKTQKFQTIIWKSGIFLFLASLFLLLVFWFTAPLLTIVRPEFAASTGALRVLSLGLPFFFLTSLTMWTLIALKRQTVLAVIYGASMVVNVFLNAWLVPTHGYMAAAWVTVGTEALVLALSGVTLFKYINVDHTDKISNS